MATIPASTVTDTAPVSQEERKFDPIPATDQFKTPTILNVEVEKVTLRPINPEFREKYNIAAEHEFNFQFKILDGDFKNRKVWGSAHAVWNDSPNCRLRLWAQEIMGVTSFPADYTFDSDHLVGQECRVTIKNYTKRDGSTGESVADVLPAVNASPTPQFMTGNALQQTSMDDTDFEPF